MKVRWYPVVLTLLLGCQIARADRPYFEFAGFTVATTLAEAESRYSQSRRANSYIYVAVDEEQNHIYGISISGHRTLLHFEKRNERGKPSYPLCRTQFNKIYAAFKGPHVVQKYNEEAMLVHNRIWIRGNERLALRCFEAEGTRYAEKVELYLVQP